MPYQKEKQALLQQLCTYVSHHAAILYTISYDRFLFLKHQDCLLLQVGSVAIQYRLAKISCVDILCVNVLRSKTGFNPKIRG